MKKIILCFFLISATVSAQKSLNNYAYVVLPDQYSFQDSADQYQLNSLTRFLFEKEGVIVFSDSEKIPKKYLMMDCAGLKLKMHKKSSMFRTKLSFDLLDCYSNTVFTSDLGESNEKDYKKGYQESIRNAFVSFSNMNYEYVPVPAAEIPIPVAVASTQVLDKKIDLPDNASVYSNNTGMIIKLSNSNGSYIGKIVSSESIDYSSEDIVCKLVKTSLPNVFKTKWKDTDGNFINTIAYFKEQGVLNVDFSSPSGIITMQFIKQ